MSRHVSWRKYIDKTSDMPPRPLLVEALQYVTHRGSALDVGAGALMDTKFLLTEGFAQVAALDPDEASAEKAKEIDAPHFHFLNQPIETLELTRETYDVINAQRSLPYLAPDVFWPVVTRLKEALTPGGILVVVVFGDRDESILPGVDMTRLPKSEIEKICSDMDILKFDESDIDKESALGTLKHFHEFAVIARKR